MHGQDRALDLVRSPDDASPRVPQAGHTVAASRSDVGRRGMRTDRDCVSAVCRMSHGATLLPSSRGVCSDLAIEQGEGVVLNRPARHVRYVGRLSAVPEAALEPGSAACRTKPSSSPTSSQDRPVLNCGPLGPSGLLRNPANCEPRFEGLGLAATIHRIDGTRVFWGPSSFNNPHLTDRADAASSVACPTPQPHRRTETAPPRNARRRRTARSTAPPSPRTTPLLPNTDRSRASTLRSRAQQARKGPDPAVNPEAPTGLASRALLLQGDLSSRVPRVPARRSSRPATARITAGPVTLPGQLHLPNDPTGPHISRLSPL